MTDVLIVDDNADIATVLQEILALEGYSSAHADHGTAALAWLAAQPTPPRLLLVDLTMPEMDGPTFIAHIQETAALRAIPIVVMTAERNPTAKLGGLPVLALLAKPFDIDELLGHLRGLAEQHAA